MSNAPKPPEAPKACGCPGGVIEHLFNCGKPAPAPEPDPLTGIDARRWAQEFMRIWAGRWSEVDESLMVAWFANAIMRGFDEGQSRLRRELQSANPVPAPEPKCRTHCRPERGIHTSGCPRRSAPEPKQICGECEDPWPCGVATGEITGDALVLRHHPCSGPPVSITEPKQGSEEPIGIEKAFDSATAWIELNAAKLGNIKLDGLTNLAEAFISLRNREKADYAAFVEMNAVFEAVMRAIRGEALSDFDLSHGSVYEANALRAELAQAREERDQYAGKLVQQVAKTATERAAREKSERENADLKRRIEVLESGHGRGANPEPQP